MDAMAFADWLYGVAFQINSSGLWLGKVEDVADIARMPSNRIAERPGASIFILSHSHDCLADVDCKRTEIEVECQRELNPQPIELL